MAKTRIKISDKQAKINWDSYFENYLSTVSSCKNETKEEQQDRIKRLEANFEEWKKYYFPKYCFAPAASFHIRASKRLLRNDEWYECRVWSRELAKDVLCMMETLYQGLTKKKKNILFISNSYDKAEELLTPYKINLEKNERIINDYGIQQLPGSWTAGDFTTTQGVSFLAVGAGQSPRGSRSEEVRPDKIIISDIDTDEDVRNSDIINKRWNWFERALFPTRSVSKDTQYVWLGNLIAKDCCVARAMKMADKVDIVNLEDEKGESTWKEKNTPEHIKRIKSKISAAAFQAEYMNNPLTEGEVFKEMHWGKMPQMRTFPFLIAYGDPATSNSESKKRSFKSVWLIGYKNSTFYVIWGYLDQVSNAEFVDWYYGVKDYVGERTQVYNYIENNTLQDPFYQQVFIPLFTEKGKEKGVIGITPDVRKKPHKFTRIEGNLEPKNRLGQLILNEKEKDNPHFKRLVEQFLLVNPQMKAAADGPDCIEGGVWVASQKTATLSHDSYSTGYVKTHKKRY